MRSQRQSRRHGESVLRVAPAQRLQGQIEREHERRTARVARARDQRLGESAIAHEIELEPERSVRRRTHVFDRADGHRAQAERHAGGLRGARRLDLAVAMKEAVSPVGASADGHVPVLAEHRGVERQPRHVHHDALAQLDGAQVVAIARPGQLVVGAAVDVIEQRARQCAGARAAQVLDGVDDGHGGVATSPALRRGHDLALAAQLLDAELHDVADVRGKSGSGLMPMPTPGGVPVVITSPGCRLMNWLR